MYSIGLHQVTSFLGNFARCECWQMMTKKAHLHPLPSHKPRNNLLGCVHYWSVVWSGWINCQPYERLSCSFPFVTKYFPQTFSTLAKQSAESDPLYRLFSREGTVGRKLLEQVRKDLADVVKVCRAELKQTNHLRTLMSCLTKGT
jgi:hypothetical protein